MSEIENLQELSLVNLETIVIEEIVLLIAKDHYPELDTSAYLKQLDEFARRARYRIEGVAGDAAIARALSHYLFDEEGFRGNTADYYNPSNNLFNDVLDQRTGMPISLCILYIAIGRRLGLDVAGVNFPGHFLVHFKSAPMSFYVDAFAKGKLLSKEECEKRLVDRYGDAIPPQEQFFQPTTHREILIRMLTNIKMSFVRRRDFENALRALNSILLFAPNGAEELKERGLIYFHLECFRSALTDLESYLDLEPQAPDREEIEACVADLRDRVSQIS